MQHGPDSPFRSAGSGAGAAGYRRTPQGNALGVATAGIASSSGRRVWCNLYLGLCLCVKGLDLEKKLASYC